VVAPAVAPMKDLAALLSTRERCACACSTATQTTPPALSLAASTFTSARAARARHTQLVCVRAKGRGCRILQTKCAPVFSVLGNRAWLGGQRIRLHWSLVQLRVCTSRPPSLLSHLAQCLSLSLLLFLPIMIGRATEETPPTSWALQPRLRHCHRPRRRTRPQIARSRHLGTSR
jgi:hypothetical protein